MTPSSTHAALLAHYALDPGVGVGPLRFGDLVSAHPELELRDPEPEYARDPELDYAEYSVPGLEEILIVHVDAEGRIDAVSFYESCTVEDHDLLGMGVGRLLVLYGLPSAVEAEEFGRDVEVLYLYDSLGLTLWTIDGEICVVQAGAAEGVRDHR